MTEPFPFSAVVGQDEAKLALVLAASEPLLGGVLLRGDKGSAKTTLARGLAALLPGDAPFVELPLGATEDRVVGSIDLASLLRDGSPEVRLGLLAAAHGGVLYVDEINLLADHLVDALLDVAVSGVNRIERDGVAHEHPARFVLIGSMNPEEGELRPQLLDRFGLCVDVHASTDRAERAEAVRRRLASDADPAQLAAWREADAEVAGQLGVGSSAAVPDAVIDLACAVALEVGAEGLRADLVLCRAAAAHASRRGAAEADDEDLRTVAPMVLGHRRRRSPLDPPGIPPEELDEAFGRAADDLGAPPDADDDVQTGDAGDGDGDDGDEGTDGGGGGTRAPAAPPAASAAPPDLRLPSARPDARAGRRGSGSADRGRFVRAAEPAAGEHVGAGAVAVAATAVAAASRRAADGSTTVEAGDVRRAVREQRTGTLVVLCVDASGSMGADRRIELAKGAVLGLLTDAYQRRDRVALVTFGGDGAAVALRPTASVEIARARLAELPTGGVSPIAEGLDAVHQLVAGSSGDHGLDPLVVVLTDGRATGSDDAVARSQASAARLAAAGVATVVVDAETGSPRLGLAAELADAAGGIFLPLDGLVDGSLERTIRLQLR